MKVDGAQAFRREVWIQARREGLEVAGYRPRDRDRQSAGEPTAPPTRLGEDIETRLRQAAAIVRILAPDPAAQARLLAAAWSRVRDGDRDRDRDRRR